MQIAAVSLKFHQRPIRSLKPQALNCFFKIGLPWIWYKQCRSNHQFICDYFPEIISPTLSLCSQANGCVRFHQVCQIIKKCCTSKFQLKLHKRVLLLLLLFFAYDSLFVSATDPMAALLHTTSSAKKQHTHTVGFLDSVPCGICLLNAFLWNTFIIYGEIGSDCTVTPPASPVLSPPAPVSVNCPRSPNNTSIALSQTVAEQ